MILNAMLDLGKILRKYFLKTYIKRPLQLFLEIRTLEISKYE